MTEYLKKYMADTEVRLGECGSFDEICDLLAEHRDKIAFMQHERIVHFLVTMMFAIILTIFVVAFIVLEQIALGLLILIILVLLCFYIKHYYFLENTVQEMYRVYDRMVARQKELRCEE